MTECAAQARPSCAGTAPTAGGRGHSRTAPARGARDGGSTHYGRRDEYGRLAREKERLQARCEKLELDLERRRIRRALWEFERLVGLLPLEDQKELFHLLRREVEVAPFEPERETPQEGPTAPRNGRAGAAEKAAAGRTLTARIGSR